MTANDMLKTGDIEGARVALLDAVRADPADARARLSLADLLIVAGDLDKADTHLDAARNLDPGWAVQASLTRQLVRAALWRRETFEAGRPPELVSARTLAVDHALAALIAEREGAPGSPDDDPALTELVGTVDGRPFTGWRDADDRTAGVLEVFTSTGNYVWVPFEHVRQLGFRPVERPRDIVWRPIDLEVAGGPSGLVYTPTLYHARVDEMTDAHRLGRATDWVEGARVRGLGLRQWLLGDEGLSPGEFTTVAVA